jgi:iron complex outermembrane receptor protein
MSLKYEFKIGKIDASVFGNVNNLFNTEYIADATDNTLYDNSSGQVLYGNELNSPVFFGFGRTWSLTLKVKF